MRNTDNSSDHREHPGSATASDEAATNVLDESAATVEQVFRRRCRTSRRPSVLPGARLPAASCRARRMPTGSRRQTKRPVDLLEEQAQTRLPELGPIRYGRMLVSPFAFFRGAAYLMAADLADGPRTGLHAQLCGDAHLSNFGIFAAPDRRLVFSINDFDETLPGTFEWDVKRLAASFAVAGRDRGFDEAVRRSAVTAAAREYREAMARFAEMRNIDVWYTRLDVAAIRKQLGAWVSGKQMKRFQSNVASVQTKDSMRALTKLCRTVDGELRIVGNPPLVTPIEDVLPGAEQEHLEDVVRRMIRTYRRTLPRDRRHLLESYRYVHAARKVVGVGSVGARTWILLLVGRDDDRSAVPPVQGGPGIGARAVSREEPVRPARAARRRRAADDAGCGRRHARLGANPHDRRARRRDFYIRQLWDSKGSADVELMDPSGLEAYGRVCGWTLARAHARSGDRIAIAAYLGSGDAFDRAMASFAETYADQNDRDYRALRRQRRPAASRPRWGSEDVLRGWGMAAELVERRELRAVRDRCPTRTRFRSPRHAAGSPAPAHRAEATTPRPSVLRSPSRIASTSTRFPASLSQTASCHSGGTTREFPVPGPQAAPREAGIGSEQTIGALSRAIPT